MMHEVYSATYVLQHVVALRLMEDNRGEHQYQQSPDKLDDNKGVAHPPASNVQIILVE